MAEGSHLDELIDGFLSGNEPAPAGPSDGPADKSADESAQQEPVGDQAPVAKDTTSDSGTPIGVPEPRFAVGDQNYTLAELASSGMLSQVLQSANNWNQLVVEQQAGQQQPLTADQFLAQHAASARQLEAGGYLDEDLNETYPKLAALVASASAQMDDFNRRLEETTQSAQQGNRDRQAHNVRDTLVNTISGVGKETGYEALTQPDVQNSIIEYMAKNNYNTSQINPETIKVVYQGALKEATQKMVDMVNSTPKGGTQQNMMAQQETNLVAPSSPDKGNNYEPMMELFQEDIPLKEAV